MHDVKIENIFVLSAHIKQKFEKDNFNFLFR